MEHPSDEKERDAGQVGGNPSEALPTDALSARLAASTGIDLPRFGGVEVIFLSPIAFFLAVIIHIFVLIPASPFGAMIGDAVVSCVATGFAMKLRGTLAGFLLILAVFLGLLALLAGACVASW